MNDMKKKLDFKVLAIMGVVVFSACGSDSDLFNPEHRQRVLLTLIAINGKILRKYRGVLRLQKKKWLRNGLKHIGIHNPLGGIGPTFLFNM